MGWEILIYSSLTMVLVLTLYSIEATVRRTEQRVKQMERYLTLIAQHLNIPLPSPVPTSIQIIASDPTRKIEAIKRYREETGVSLKEAKAAIEEMLRQNHPR